MGGKSKAITAVLVLALCAGMGYFLLVEKQRRDQRQNVVRLLGDTTAHLRTALNGAAAPELVAHRFEPEARQGAAPTGARDGRRAVHPRRARDRAPA